MSEWVSVKDRLPKLEEEVLTLSRGKEIRVSAYCKFGDELGWVSRCQDSCGCCDDYDSNITHWMPLPEPPERTEHE